MLEAAGSNVFSWNFIELYGMNPDQLVPWNTFLQGKSDVASLTAWKMAGPSPTRSRRTIRSRKSRCSDSSQCSGRRAEQGEVRALSALAPP